jgi:flagellar L-ring protein precursor FlgH
MGNLRNALLVLVFMAMPAMADSLYNEMGYSSLIGDRLGDRRSTFAPGTLVTVLVSEDMSASSGATTKTTKDSRAGLTWDFGSLFPKLTKSATDLRGTTNFNGDGQTARSGKISMEISSRIQEVMPDGSLKISGTKSLKINDEESTVFLTGIIRPYDVDSLNRVPSTKVADLKLDYKGSGPASAKATPGLLTRIFNWLL